MGGSARAFLLLAASGLHESDLRSFLLEVENDGARLAFGKISRIRDAAEEDTVSRSASAQRSSHDSQRLREYSNTIQKIIGLLIEQSGLSKTEAARELRSELMRVGMAEVDIPAYRKVAFDLWLARLLDQLSESTVLHVASKVRNDLVHGGRTRSNWPLSEADNEH